MADLIASPPLRQRIGTAGRISVLSRFSLRRMVERTETLYRTCLGLPEDMRVVMIPNGARPPVHEAGPPAHQAAPDRRVGSQGGAMTRRRTGPVVYIPSGYPVVTETFVYREVLQLRRDGLALVVLPLRARPESFPSGPLRAETEKTEYVGYLSWGMILRGLRTALRRPVRSAGAAALLVRYLLAHRRDLRVVLLTLGILPKLLALLGRIDALDACRVHAHFANLPAFVAMMVAEVLGIPFSFTGHAWDLHVDENRAGLPLKVSRATFVATCTAHNAAFLRTLCPGSGHKIMLNRHGLDLDAVARVQPLPAKTEVPFLAGGRLVPQKGLSVLLAAWRVLLDRGVPAHCEIVGTGPLRDQLEAEIAGLGLAAHVRLVGSMQNEELMARLASCRGFVLPCLRTPDGFMDGIPNIVAEAMALARPVVSTRLSGVPELVEDGVSGLLAEPGDPRSLADSVEHLIRDPELAARIGIAGRARVRAMFDLRTNVGQLALRLRGAGGRPGSAAASRASDPVTGDAAASRVEARHVVRPGSRTRGGSSLPAERAVEIPMLPSADRSSACRLPTRPVAPGPGVPPGDRP